MKKTFLIALSCFIFGSTLFGQEISPYLVGINGWMTEKIGGSFEPLMSTRLGPCKAADKAMNAKMVRIGGWNYSYDSANGIATKEFLGGICKKIIDNGSIPLLQVPHTISAADLKTWITYLNGTLGLNIKNWLIGNEPDHQNVAMATVETYTKELSFVIRDNVPDATIYAIGMSQIANMSNTLWLLDNLGGKDSKGRYIIDVVSFHDYASQNSGNINWGNVDNILGKVNSINAGRTASRLKWMMGEFNTSWSNNIVDQWHKSYCFNAGQVFIRIAKGGIERGAWSLMPWSIEENGSSRGDADLGMFDSKNGVRTPRSTAVHWTMLGRTLRSTYLPIDAPQGVTIASKDQYGYSLLIANDGATICSFGLSFNGTMSFSAGSTYNVAAYSTSVFTFDLTGKLTGQANYTPAMSDSWTEPATYPMATSCDDTVLSSIQLSVARTTVGPNDLVTLMVTGRSSCQAVAVTNVTWSTNASGGVFQSATKGVYTITARVGNLSSSVTITVKDLPLMLKIEAESYSAETTVVDGAYDKVLAKENGGLSIGYYNNIGETVTYNVNVPVAGEYDLVLKYCSAGAGTVGLKVGSGAEQPVSFDASGGTTWYSLAFADWPVSVVSKVILPAGAQTITIVNKGVAINLDYIELTNNTSTNSLPKPTKAKAAIFPNPSNGQFTIDVDNTYTVDVYDVIGNIVLSQIVYDTDNTVNLGNKKGLFLVKIYNNTESYVERVVVN